MKISQYAPAKSYASVEPDIYPATIIEASVIMDEANPGLAAVNQWGKSQILVRFELDEVGDDGGNIELRRKLSISYGAMGGTYAPLATLIQAATGIKCGDKGQRNVTTEELVGRRLRVQTDNVEKDGRVYTNIMAFLPLKKAAPKAAPAPVEEPDQDLNDEIPF